MECPVCDGPMTHLGYFRWACDECGHDCQGELPPAASEDESA
jgi:hypothetical protein